MSDLPAPLVPANVDLTDFAFMPLDARRLRDSRFTATVDGEAFRAGVLLWCASWHQLPAASLPDDDVELAQLAGFGRVVKEWRKLRADALHGWIKCSDGRLYHPVVAEKALEAWESKQQHAYRKATDRLRKENKRREGEKLPPLPIPTFEQWNSGDSGGGIPAEAPDSSAGIPAENALKGQGQGQGYNTLPPVECERAREPAGAGHGITWPVPEGPPPWAPYEAELRGLPADLVPEVYTRWRDHRLARGMTPVDPVADWRAWCSGEVKRLRDGGPGPPPTARRHLTTDELLEGV